jgi:hypothetical protein
MILASNAEVSVDSRLGCGRKDINPQTESKAEKSLNTEKSLIAEKSDLDGHEALPRFFPYRSGSIWARYRIHPGVYLGGDSDRLSAQNAH